MMILSCAICKYYTWKIIIFGGCILDEQRLNRPFPRGVAGTPAIPRLTIPAPEYNDLTRAAAGHLARGWGGPPGQANPEHKLLVRDF